MILALQLNVPDRNFTEGFPGVPGGLIEWFGIRFDAKLQVPNAGNYKFLITSDDGSRLYIDGDTVVNNDGLSVVERRNTPSHGVAHITSARPSPNAVCPRPVATLPRSQPSQRFRCHSSGSTGSSTTNRNEV